QRNRHRARERREEARSGQRHEETRCRVYLGLQVCQHTDMSNRPVRTPDTTSADMKLCRFDDGRLGLVEPGQVRDVTAALDVLPAYRYPLPPFDPLIAN